MITLAPENALSDDEAWAQSFCFGVCRNALDHRITLYDLAWPEFVQKLACPLTVADKKKAPAIVPATFSAPYAKNENIIGLTALMLDIEQHGGGPEPMPIDDADEYLAETGLAYALWSTFSNRPEKPRYRVLFPLDGVLPPRHTKRAYGLLTASLEAFAGVVDGSCFHPARLFFLPCVEPGREAEYTMHASVYGAWLKADRLAEACEIQEQEERRQAEAKRRQFQHHQHHGASIIQEFNATADIGSLLEAAGYTKRGKKWLSPHSHSGIPGIVMFDDGRVYCHHESDPLHDPHGLDAFGIFCRIWHNGDAKAACAALRKGAAA